MNHSASLLEFYFYEDNSLLEEIDRIIKRRWRKIERTTKYGWLSASFHEKTIPEENAKTLSILAKKIGSENCQRAIEKIRKLSRNLHPKHIPVFAIAVLEEEYTSSLLNVRCKSSKTSGKSKLVENRLPTVFTIPYV